MHTRLRVRYELLHWTPEMVKNFWDWQSSRPGEYFAERYAGAILRLLAPHLPPQVPVLDYACGSGRLLEVLVSAGFQAAGFDISPDSRERVARRLAGRSGFLGVFGPDDLAGRSRQFAAVTVLEAVEHLYDPQLDALLENVHDLLAEDGLLLLTTPNEEDLERSYVLCPVTNQLFHRYQHVRSWSGESLTACLEARGFEVVSCAGTDLRRSTGPGASWRQRWRALRFRWKGLRKPGRKPPHLVALARRRRTAMDRPLRPAPPTA